MDRNIVRQLMYSVVQFLRSQLEGTPSLSDEGIESVEVALQCLETAYSISSDNTELAVSKPLYDLFVEGVGDQACRTDATKTTVERTEAAPEDKAEAELLKNEGNQLMRDEKFSEALERYTKAIGKDSGNAVYFCNRAAAHSKLNNHMDAIEDCRRALDIESNYSKAYGRMGLAYSSMNNHLKAKECYEMALYLDPENESYRSNLSIANEKILSGSSPAAPTNPFAALAGGDLGALAGIGTGGAPELSGIFNNPALMNMATQLMSDPNMQNMMTQILGGMGGSGGGGGGGGGGVGGGSSAGPMPSVSSTAPSSTVIPPAGPAVTPPAQPPTSGGMDALLNAGRQLAEQMQNQHPELVEQLRSQMNRNNENGGNSGGGNGSS